MAFVANRGIDAPREEIAAEEEGAKDGKAANQNLRITDAAPVT